MTGAAEFGDGASVCDSCGDVMENRRYARLEGTFLYLFCTVKCVRAAAREQSRRRWVARRLYAKRLAIGLLCLGAFLAPHQRPQPLIIRAAPLPVVHRFDPMVLPPGWYGPDWPPTEISLLAALGRDTWVHPLAGPVRRMPRTDARVFGAVRPGDRAVECRNGHCGVDLGGEIWGEHVRAVHDGVVDFVQRGANEDRGGRFVRLSHREGTVFTQYFHLAAIPRELERGMAIKGGDVVGLLGDSGVKESAPHLHFSISVRPSKDWPEKYIDPEPLIALWPLRIPIDGSEVGLVTTLAEAGVPLGSLPPKAGRDRKLAKQKRGGKAAKSQMNGTNEQEERPSEEEPMSDTATPDPATDE